MNFSAFGLTLLESLDLNGLPLIFQRGNLHLVDAGHAQHQAPLGRPASAAEISNWLMMLPTLGRGGVASGIVDSAEARTDAVLQFYVTLLHRTAQPGAAELAAWVNSSFDLLSIEVLFAGSGEFYTDG